MAKGALNVDKAIWELYEQIPHLLAHPPYGEKGRYIAYYAAEKLYLVFDLCYHGFFLVEADSPKDAIENVNCDRLKYIPKESEDSGYNGAIIEQAIKALEQQSIAEERYQDLVEYFGDKDVAKCILEDREEFKKWLERIKWHVQKADELARKLVFEMMNRSTSDDCVSRQAVRDAIMKCETMNEDSADGFIKSTTELEAEIACLPPVTPTHGTCKELKAFSDELKGRMKNRDEDNGGEPLNAVDRGYHLAFEHLCKEIDSLLADFERSNNG